MKLSSQKYQNSSKKKLEYTHCLWKHWGLEILMLNGFGAKNSYIGFLLHPFYGNFSSKKKEEYHYIHVRFSICYKVLALVVAFRNQI